ncbi:MAG: right-handed parallel beta-helix repeat-containing protein [Chloroflexi bacterium]|nr:right-handed parallel beta-helix repeat-containing protein [Chloroflexota bacterium]
MAWHGMADEHARWAVGTWALVLGVSTVPVTELRPSDPVRPPVPDVPEPAPVADPGRPRLVVDAGAVGSAYATIGEAIRAAVVPGTLITVKPGIYREALEIDRVVEIVGEGDRARIAVEVTDTDAITVTADRAAVRNLTVRAEGCGDTSGAVWVQRGRVVIEGCDLTSAIGSVVYITGKDSAPVIRDCQIRDGQGSGVRVWEQGQGTIEKCVISGNANAGVAIRTGGNPIVRDCGIRSQWGITVRSDGRGSVSGCDLTGTTTPWWIEGGAKVTRTGNRPNA